MSSHKEKQAQLLTLILGRIVLGPCLEEASLCEWFPFKLLNVSHALITSLSKHIFLCSRTLPLAIFPGGHILTFFCAAWGWFVTLSFRHFSFRWGEPSTSDFKSLPQEGILQAWFLFVNFYRQQLDFSIQTLPGCNYCCKHSWWCPDVKASPQQPSSTRPFPGVQRERVSGTMSPQVALILPQ